MRRTLAAVAIGLFLVGCQSEPAATPDRPVAAAPQADLVVSGPIEPTDSIGLFRGALSVRVGDTWEKAKEVYPPPSRGSYDLRELPEFFGEGFDVHGWENGRGEGFGVITYQSKTVAAMYQLERSNEPVLSELLQSQHVGTGAVAPVIIKGARVRYWFWHQANQSLMISAFSTPRGINLTAAMGDRRVLDALGISDADARRDAARLDSSPTPPKMGEQPTAPARS